MKEFHLCKVIILFACLYEYKCRSFYFWSLDHKKSSKGPFLVFRHGYYLLQCLPMCLTLARYATMQTELKTGRGGEKWGSPSSAGTALQLCLGPIRCISLGLLRLEKVLHHPAGPAETEPYSCIPLPLY